MTAFATVDHEALRAEAEALLHGSPLWSQIQGGIVLDVHRPEVAFGVLGDLVQNVLASVEIVKKNCVDQQDPDGSKGLKFDSSVAFDTALTILDEAIRFNGVFGKLLDYWDRPVLKFFIEVGIAAWRGKDWLAAAKALLALV